MQTPIITPVQFLDAQAFNAAIASILANDTMMNSVLFMPGLANAMQMMYQTSGLQVTFTLPAPFAVLFQNGVLAQAHGVVDDADTDSYEVDLTPLVPSSGSVTAYIVASQVAINQDPYTVTGPPVGHPDYDPNFSPFQAYAVSQYSLAVTATLTPPDNMTTFELGRYTLNAGQVNLPAMTLQYQTMIGVNAMMSSPELNTMSGDGFVANPTANGYALVHTFSFAGVIPTNFSSSAGSCLVAPTNTVSYTIYYYPANGGARTQIGNITIAAGAYSAVFTGTEQTVNPNDRVVIVGPSANDPTLEGVSFTLVASITT